MPTYEYVCGKCKRRLEIFQKITDPPRRRCPSCRGTLRRTISGGAGLIFRGSGFYITDYRSESYKKAERMEKAGSTESSASKPSASDPKGGSKDRNRD